MKLLENPATVEIENGIEWRFKFIAFSAVAEPPLTLSVSVPLAIRKAVASARTDADSKAERWFPFGKNFYLFY